MILTDLRNYISERGSVTQAELAKHFATNEDAINAMLEIWLKKGQLSRLVDTNKNGEVIRIRYRLNQGDQLSLVVTM